jgi:hypothetical protein
LSATIATTDFVRIRVSAQASTYATATAVA